MSRIIRVLGTGGTIAGTAPKGAAESAYQAAQLAVEDLLQPLLPSLPGGVERVEAVQVAQIDSRDMDHVVWQALAAELLLGRAVGAVGQVVTHGTDTLEETAVFLDRVVGPGAPVVLTAAMRPATSPQADGPENLRRALHLAADPRAQGILMAFGGRAWSAPQVRKVHPFAMDAFSGGDGEPLAVWDQGRWQWQATSPAPGPSSWKALDLPRDVREWPRVEIVHSHAGVDGEGLRALLQPRPGVSELRGVVVSATGNGSIHHTLDAVLKDAVATGRLQHGDIRVATRCVGGWVVGEPAHGWAVAARLTPAQARVALMLEIASR